MMKTLGKYFIAMLFLIIFSGCGSNNSSTSSATEWSNDGFGHTVRTVTYESQKAIPEKYWNLLVGEWRDDGNQNLGLKVTNKSAKILVDSEEIELGDCSLEVSEYKPTDGMDNHLFFKFNKGADEFASYLGYEKEYETIMLAPTAEKTEILFSFKGAGDDLLLLSLTPDSKTIIEDTDETIDNSEWLEDKDNFEDDALTSNASDTYDEPYSTPQEIVVDGISNAHLILAATNPPSNMYSSSEMKNQVISALTYYDPSASSDMFQYTYLGFPNLDNVYVGIFEELSENNVELKKVVVIDKNTLELVGKYDPDSAIAGDVAAKDIE